MNLGYFGIGCKYIKRSSKKTPVFCFGLFTKIVRLNSRNLRHFGINLFFVFKLYVSLIELNFILDLVASFLVYIYILKQINENNFFVKEENYQ